MAKKIYVFDTSVCLSDSESIKKFGNNDIILPLKVLEEIDNHKKRQDVVGTNARNVIRFLDSLRVKHCLQKGARIAKGKGLLSVTFIHTNEISKLLSPFNLKASIPDHVILATALHIQKENIGRKVIVVSRDINMRVICDSIGLQTEDYIVNQVVKSSENLYTGFTTHLVDEQVIDQFYNGEKVHIEGDTFFPNQYIMLVSNSDPKKTALVRYINDNLPLKKIIHKRLPSWGIEARNKEQTFALDLLMDPKVQVITLIGKAGSGKTLCAIAAGLEQVTEKSTKNTDPKYKKLVVSRPIQPMGKDIGFLPGTMQEKMTPWLAPIQDNLRFLLGDDKIALELYLDKGIIELEALTYIRGRSISNAFIIIDEAQNLTIHEVKTIITRVGEGTKIVLTGDIEQIDNAYTDETSNGLAYAVEKFKLYDIAGHVTLQKGERSNVATLAASIL
jgi:PhoH-like ATPase|tara:strand:+ start:8518 stop:9855 length:1338 start_codon:yes stop_codon:yes gene_type:complete